MSTSSTSTTTPGSTPGPTPGRAPGSTPGPTPGRAPEAPILTRPFLMLVGAHLLQALGFSSMLLLPLYLDHLEASRAAIGAVMATAGIGGLLSRPLVGWALDTVGRKPTLTVGTLVLTVGMLMVGLVEDMGPTVWLMRLIVGAGAGALFTAYFTMAADIVPAERRTEGLALFGISGLVPLLVNPFADRIGIQPQDLQWFLPAVGGLVACSLLFLPFVPEVGGVRGNAPLQFRSIGRALSAPALRPVWVATTVFAGLVAIFMSFATVAAADGGSEHPATVWLTYSGGAVLVRALGARLPERLGPARVGGVALLSYIAGLLVASTATTDGGFAIAGVLAGVGHGYAFPVLSSQTITRSPEALRGVAMSAFTGIWELSRLILAPAFGAVADATDDTTMLRAAAASAFVGVVIWALMERRLGPRRPPS